MNNYQKIKQLRDTISFLSPTYVEFFLDIIDPNSCENQISEFDIDATIMMAYNLYFTNMNINLDPLIKVYTIYSILLINDNIVINEELRELIDLENNNTYNTYNTYNMIKKLYSSQYILEKNFIFSEWVGENKYRIILPMIELIKTMATRHDFKINTLKILFMQIINNFSEQLTKLFYEYVDKKIHCLFDDMSLYFLSSYGTAPNIFWNIKIKSLIVRLSHGYSISEK